MCAVKTNAEKAGWSRRYQTALRKHLKQGPKSSLQPALGLGRQAAALGLEPLDVVRIHKRALAIMEASRSRDGISKRAGLFFAETITPIERTHRAAMSANRHLKHLTATLNRRTSGLAASKRRVKLRISQRKIAEEALKISGEHSANLLLESHRLHEHLRHLTHRILLAQEHERKRVSLELQDEIAQTLLGINVRLLALRTGAATNASGLKKEVASTQRLVGKSVKLMARYSHELGRNHET